AEAEGAFALAEARETLELHRLPEIEPAVVLALAVLAPELLGEADDARVVARRQQPLETERARAVARLAVFAPFRVESCDLAVCVVEAEHRRERAHAEARDLVTELARLDEREGLFGAASLEEALAERAPRILARRDRGDRFAEELLAVGFFFERRVHHLSA